MIVGYVGLGMRIEMRLCTIMRVIIKVSTSINHHTSHVLQPSAAMPIIHVLYCLLSHYSSTTLRRRFSPVPRIFVESATLLSRVLTGKVTPKRQNWLVTYIGVYYSTDPARICVQKTTVSYTKHADRIQFPQKKQDILIGEPWRRGSEE